MSERTHVAPTDRAIQRLRAVLILSIVVPCVVFAVIADILYRQAFDDARRDLESSSRIAQEHALKLFNTNEMLLQRMLDLVEHTPAADLRIKGRDLHDKLKAMADDLPQVQGLFINGADGHMIASSRVFPTPLTIDFSDREWFQAHRRGSGRVFVTEQLRSRSTGEAAFDMSTRWNLPSGEFAGVVNVSLRPEYLTEFWAQIGALTEGIRIAVIREDGRLVARWPGEVSEANGKLGSTHPLMIQIAASAASGNADGPSQFEPMQRMRTYRKLAQYPLVVVSSLDKGTVLAGWRKEMAVLALWVLPVSIAFAWLAWLALVRTREEMGAIQDLEAARAHRQRIELALLQSQKMEALGRLTGGVAHDFNNLLMVVSSNLFLLKRLRPEVASDRQVAAIQRAVGSGSNLTRQLLAFARRQPLMPQALLLQERLPPMLDLLRPLLGPSIALSCEIEPETRPIVVDSAELELALINLAVNARDAMQGAGSFAIKVGNSAGVDVDAQEDFVVIAVQDSGPGIDASIVEKVFEPFFTTKAVGEGTGLGLSQVHAFCQAAGGHARISAAPIRGAIVTLYLRAGTMQFVEPPAAIVEATDLNCSVLLVEDNKAVAQATHDILESMGCRVTHLESGADALQYLGSHSEDVDIVLSDITMPGAVDGFALATQLAQKFPSLPVVLMTGYSSRLQQAVAAGFEVIPKPCTPADLAAYMAKGLAGRRRSPAA